VKPYDADFYAWTKAQADALRRHAVDELDWVNLEDEIKSLGSKQWHDIHKHLATLILRLLKWHYRPERQCRAWASKIDGARRKISDLISESPSLKDLPDEALPDAYRSAVNQAAIRRLELYHLPQDCPWAIDQVMDPEFWP
jgi:Domain of unknown function DUF29